MTFLDAGETLSAFLVDGMPDRQRFRQRIGTALNTVRNRRYGMAIRAFGEMVDILWREGRTQAAIALEDLWNELRLTESFSLLCAYKMSDFEGSADSEGVKTVSSLHAHALPSESNADSMSQVTTHPELV
jgi:hypothetical protein